MFKPKKGEEIPLTNNKTFKKEIEEDPGSEKTSLYGLPALIS
jgi:hypothetical protein